MVFIARHISGILKTLWMGKLYVTNWAKGSHSLHRRLDMCNHNLHWRLWVAHLHCFA